MDDCISTLYTALMRIAPYSPNDEIEQEVYDEYTKAYEQLTARLPELHDELWVLYDKQDTLAYFRSRYSFALGIDLGLSLGRELGRLYDE